jgi:hypothetical protein
LPHQNGKVKHTRRTDLADCWCTTSPTAADAIKRLAEQQNHVSRVDLHSALDGAFPLQLPPPALLPQTVVVHDLQHHTQDCAAAGRPPALLKRHSCFGTAPGCAICLDNFREFGETLQVADPG